MWYHMYVNGKSLKGIFVKREEQGSQALHYEIAVQGRCSGADQITRDKDRVGVPKEYDIQVCAWEPREKLQEEQKS